MINGMPIIREKFLEALQDEEGFWRADSDKWPSGCAVSASLKVSQWSVSLPLCVLCRVLLRAEVTVWHLSEDRLVNGSHGCLL